MGKSPLTKIAIPSLNPHWDNWSYRLGCPVWGCKEWNDSVYPKGTASESYLSWYSQCFPTVEGNSTFYAVPGQETFVKWRDASAATFQFCFKFPRSISHDRKLLGCSDLLRSWLERLSVLRDAGKLGPTFLQLAPSFSFRQYDALEAFLRQLPRDWPWAVEVRHRDWFDESDCELRFNDLLRSLDIDRVIFDSRPLNVSDAEDASEQKAQDRKPKSPIRLTVTGKRPMVRLIGRNQLDQITEYWQSWSEVLVGWIREGLQPWIFTHAPDDAYAPFLARHLHDSVRLLNPAINELPSLKTLLEHNASNKDDDKPTQLTLF